MSEKQKMFIFSAIFMLYGGLNFYIFDHFSSLLNAFMPVWGVIICAVVYALIALTLPLAFLPIKDSIHLKVRSLGMHWMGLFVYLLLFLSISDFAWFLISPFYKNTELQNIIYCIIFVLSFALTLLGIHGDKKLKITKYKVRLSDSQNKLRIAMVSDLHLGSVNTEKRIPDIVRRINNLDADIICMVGDIFDGDFSTIQNPNKILTDFQNLNSKYGVYACLGNHDAGETCEQMITFLREAGIHLLNEELSVIDNRYVLVGRLDAFPIGGYADFMFRIPAHDTMQWARKYNLPIIVMDHTPPKKKDMSKIKHYYGNVLLLCGHTHKGQIWPFGFVTKMLFANDYGYLPKEGDRPHIITSCGAGTWGMPMRVGTTREIVRIDVD